MRRLLFIFLTTLLACGQQETRLTCDISPEARDYGYASKYGFVTYSDLDLARQCSKQTGRPILIMFTGWACISIPDLPWRVLQDKEVKDLVHNNYILTTLYIDDRTLLNKIDTTKKTLNGRAIKTIGDKNITFQIEQFQNTSQPLYAIVDEALNKLTAPIGYVPSTDKQIFVDFLENGIKNRE